MPSRLIKYRFEPEIIKKLETIKWWDKPIGWIIAHANEFDDIDSFIKSREEDLLNEFEKPN